LIKYTGKAELLLGRIFTKREQYQQAEEKIRAALTKLTEVGNPKQLCLTHTALAKLYTKMNRPDLEREQWQAANTVVQSTVDVLEDETLKKVFINAAPVQEILEKVFIKAAPGQEILENLK